MIRWIAVLIVGLGVVASAYVFGLSWGEFLAESQRVRDLRAQVAQVEAAQRTKAHQMSEAAGWNQVWDDVRASRFDPGKWVVTPVNLSRDMYWRDFQELILLVSNANTLEAGYWFRPQSLRLVKLHSPLQEQRPAQRQTADGEDAMEPAPLPRPINVHIRGEFLRMKES